MAGQNGNTQFSTPAIKHPPNSGLHNRFRHQHVETAAILGICGSGLSLEKVANSMGMSRSAIRRRLKKEGLRACRDKECRRAFRPKNPKHVQQFCSAACRRRSNRRSNRDWINARRRKKPVLTTCARAGCTVQFLKRGVRMYCTPKCCRAVYDAHLRPFLTKECPECGTEFRYKRKKKIFCSVKCKKRATGHRERELLREAKRGAAPTLAAVEKANRILDALKRGAAKAGRSRDPKKRNKIGLAVEKQIESASRMLAAKADLPRPDRENWSRFNTAMRALGFSESQIELSFSAKARQSGQLALARHLVADAEGMSFDAVKKHHQMYLDDQKSKPSTAFPQN